VHDARFPTMHRRSVITLTLEKLAGSAMYLLRYWLWCVPRYLGTYLRT
jgi:hypothetical protein